MVNVDLVDRHEYCIGGDWSVHEIIVMKCPVCGADTVEAITYQDMTLFYHCVEPDTDLLNTCTEDRAEQHITREEMPFFRIVPANF